MKKVFLMAIMLVGITTFAQDKKERTPKHDKLTSEQKVDKHVDRLKTDLTLNEKQTVEVKALMTKEAAKRDAKRTEMKAQKDKDRATMKANMDKEQDAMKAEMKKILTADQYAKWEKQREENKTKMIDKFKERKGKSGDLKDK